MMKAQLFNVERKCFTYTITNTLKPSVFEYFI